jgi:hypothetical protein
MTNASSMGLIFLLPRGYFGLTSSLIISPYILAKRVYSFTAVRGTGWSCMPFRIECFEVHLYVIKLNMSNELMFGGLTRSSAPSASSLKSE